MVASGAATAARQGAATLPQGRHQDRCAHQAEARRRFYSSEGELAALDFQPGIAIDIAYVVQVGLKLAIDLLNRHNPRHVPRLLGQLSQYTLVCNSNDRLLGGEAAEIFSYPLQVTTSIQVGCFWPG